MTFKQLMTFEKSTKNTYVFKAQGGHIDTLYISKLAFVHGGVQPATGLTIEVTVKDAAP